ncbi:hypothetical protein F1189_31135 [Rhodovastum atsumiense]|uniref:Recombinase zinc beta ribbon domain-containing protein n=2 Tax=Rhodovastum atsumiense TaxID=504468 RepID=A0A5M6IKB2_9PROT|nr:hypothetical protein F1189_31135 [Rhodovastum atsumiense]
MKLSISRSRSVSAPFSSNLVRAIVSAVMVGLQGRFRGRYNPNLPGDQAMAIHSGGGRSYTTPRDTIGSIRVSEQWAVMRRDCWPAYIDWDTYTRNQEQMAANRAKHDGVPRGGPALLGGIIRCGQCGRRMSVGYHNNGREARYLCWQLATIFGGPRCQSASAQPIDSFVTDLILASLAPSAIEVSLQLAEDIEIEHAARQRHWAQRLEWARYETSLARRRYEAVDPENRLVARTLERDWEAVLACRAGVADRART